MAKKTVATLRDLNAKNYAKVIKAVKSKKSDAYTFREEMVPLELVKDHFKS